MLRTSRNTVAVFAALAVVLAGASRVRAQSATAALSGTVADESGAVVRDVVITLVNVDTGARRGARSGDQGYFSVPLLDPGRYTMTAALPGFATAEITNLVLNVNDRIALQVVLKVAALGENVRVEAPAVRASTSPAVATVIDRGFVSSMPLNGRNLQALVALAPGVVVTPASNSLPGQFSVNGQRTDANYFTIDGVSANFGISNNVANYQGLAGAQPALTASGGTASLVSIDALEEFKIQTSSYAPEFGRSPGAQVQLITRSGSNNVSGSAFENFRSDRLDANDWFANARGLAKAALSQHNFGVTVGGPAVRDSLFFFGSYEGLRLTLPQVAQGWVPSMRVRAQSPEPFRSLANGFPVPNGSDETNVLTGEPTGFAQFTSNHSDRARLGAVSVRADWRPKPGSSLFTRVHHAPSSTNTRAGASSVVSTTDQNTDMSTIGVNTVIGSRLVNELRANYSRQTSASTLGLDDWSGAIVPDRSLLFPPSSNPSGANLLFFFNGHNVQLAAGASSTNLQHQVNVTDSLGLQTGRHAWKFGADYRRLTPTRGPTDYQLTLYVLSRADAERGNITSTFRTSQAQSRPLFRNLSLFAQDTWSLGPRATTTYGLRWELNAPGGEQAGDEALTITGTDAPATFRLAPRGTPLYQVSYSNLAPRLGIAYRLHNADRRASTLRAGGGLFYDTGGNDLARGYGGYPFKIEASGAGGLLPLSAASVARPVLPAIVGPPIAGTIYAYADDFRTPRTWQWNGALEQELGGSQTVTVTYVGARGIHLVRQETRSRPTPDFLGSVNIIRSDATSRYDALQIEYNKRLSHGVQAFAGYTLAEAIDEVSDSFSYVKLRGPADFDVRHTFNTAVSWTPLAVGTGWARWYGGWSFDTIIRARSAPPISVFSSQFVTLDGQSQDVRPNVRAGVPLYLDDPTVPGGRRFNNNVDPLFPGCVGALCVPPAGTQGNLGRNVFRGFAAQQIDLAVRRTVPVGRFRAKLSVEAFNVFNHPNFGAVTGSVTSSSFGVATAMLGRSLGGLSPLYQIGGPRSVQLAARLEY